MNRHKAKLVVKGYAQAYGIDYFDTSTPIAGYDTIRMLVALSAKKGWRVYHLDIKSAFLNGYLNGDIYIEQPEGYEEKGFEGKDLRMITWKTKYAKDLFKFNMESCKPVHMPLSTGDKLCKLDGVVKANGLVFRSLIGSLFGIFSWNSKKQEVVTQSSTEAEYIATSAAANHIQWLRKILSDLRFHQTKFIIFNVDNKFAIAIAKNPVQHGQTKHMRALRELVKNNEIDLQYRPKDEQIADIFTKGL
ncbi:Reverse transcriptase [Theobroma cacao]|nr:Reverse transcriptase [Theobroma cacao]